MLALHEQLAHSGDRARRRSGWSARRENSDAAPLMALAGNALGERFRAWRGASGRRYVFSVYDRQSQPAFEHAVAVAVAVEEDGASRIVLVEDTGCFPELVLARALEGIAVDREIEFHIHLLATSRADRAAVIADLAQPRRS